MFSTLILPENTDLYAIKEKLEMLRDFTIIPSGIMPQKNTTNIFLDLTFDLYNKIVTPSYLYKFFSESESILNSLISENNMLILLKCYPFRTNIKQYQHKQKLIDNFIEILVEFYKAKILTVPTIVSRHCFQLINNPPILIINALRLEKSENIKIKKSSRFFLLYERDFLEVLMNPGDKLSKNMILEGVELSLDEIYSRTQKVTGESPISFDTINFVNYEYPQNAMDSFKAVNYDLEDMIMDITSFLF